jgi:hypothetical protein
MLDGEETAALVKLRDGLDRLHQSKILLKRDLCSAFYSYCDMECE